MPSRGRKANAPARRSRQILSRNPDTRDTSTPINGKTNFQTPSSRLLRRPLKLTPKASISEDNFLAKSSKDRLARAQESTPSEDGPLTEVLGAGSPCEASTSTTLGDGASYAVALYQTSPSPQNDSKSEITQLSTNAERSGTRARSQTSTSADPM